MKKLLIMTAALMLLSTQLYAGNGDLIVNGNLGVGTTPGYKLDVNGTINSTVSGGSNLYLTKTTGASIAFQDGAYQNALIEAGSSANSNRLEFWTNTSTNSGIVERMIIDNSGNVGIGTTTPYKTLHVHAGVNSNLIVRQGSDYGTGFSGIALNPADDANTTGTMLVIAGTPTVFTGSVGIGTTNPGSYQLYVAGPAYSTAGWQPSDINFKKDIEPVDSPLTKLLSLNGVSYEWKTDEYKDKGFPEGRHYGVVAQEIEKVLPEVVNTAPDGTKSVAYTEIIPVLIEAMKAQQKAIDGQQKKIEELEKKVSQLP